VGIGQDPRRTPLLTKLHGSVDWVWGTDSNDLQVVRPNHPEFHNDHRHRAIIYPGFKGVPEREPFVSFHRYFADCLKRADRVIFVGFAFRDDYLNRLIHENLSAHALKVIVNPVAPDKLPFGNALEGKELVFIGGKGFGDLSAMDALESHLR
jgi:hypothetical protein